MQLLETFALIERKDDTVRLLSDELEKVYERVRKYILMQDQLYMDYVEEVGIYKESEDKAKEELQNVWNDLRNI